MERRQGVIFGWGMGGGKVEIAMFKLLVVVKTRGPFKIEGQIQ